MKKYLSLLCILSLTACGGSDGTLPQSCVDAMKALEPIYQQQEKELAEHRERTNRLEQEARARGGDSPKLSELMYPEINIKHYNSLRLLVNKLTFEGDFEVNADKAIEEWRQEFESRYKYFETSKYERSDSAEKFAQQTDALCQEHLKDIASYGEYKASYLKGHQEEVRAQQEREAHWEQLWQREQQEREQLEQERRKQKEREQQQ